MSRLGVLQAARLNSCPPKIPNVQALHHRCYATQRQTNARSRRQVTVANDDGRVNWSELSAREKAARTTQQSFNFLVIVVGLSMTGAVGYFMFNDVFSYNSKTSHFNRAVSRIKSSSECTEILGDPKNLFAYGESPWSSFARARVDGPTALSKKDKDSKGTEHIRIRFMVKGPRNEGWVNVHMIREPEQMDFEYLLLALDVKGHQRVYLEGGTTRKSSRSQSPFDWFR